MGLKSIYMFILLLLCSALQGQYGKIEVAVSRNYRMITNDISWDPGKNGGSLSATYNFRWKQRYLVKFGGELGASGIGNHIASRGGIHMFIELPFEKIGLSVGLETVQGIALFEPSGLYFWGAGESNTLYYRFNNGNTLGWIFDLRYQASPGYARYSNIYRYFNIQTGIQFSFL